MILHEECIFVARAGGMIETVGFSGAEKGLEVAGQRGNSFVVYDIMFVYNC